MKILKKIKWLNVIKALIMLSCLILIIHDLFMVTVYSWITSQLIGWTWLGLVTLFIAIMLASLIYEDFEEQINIKKETV